MLTSNSAHHIAVPPTPSQQNAIRALSIDNLIFGVNRNTLNILLIKHDNFREDRKWALPGGWIRYDENLNDAAKRLLKDLTGIDNLFLEQLRTFGHIGRYPHERVVTVAYYALINSTYFASTPLNQSSKLAWHDINNLPDLVYDHEKIIRYAINVIQQQSENLLIYFKLLPDKFTFLQLQEIYEAIFNKKLDKPNFRRKILKSNLVIPCNEKQQDVPHRAANYFIINTAQIEHILKNKVDYS